MAVKPKAKPTEIEVIQLHVGQVRLMLKGTSPLIFHRMAAKAKRELLMPAGRKTMAQRAHTMKHDPIEEFIDSVHRWPAGLDSQPTRLLFPTPALKAALASAAKDIPTSVAKAQVGRLTWIEGDHVAVYGVPQLLMSVVRSADINKTPDIRTRAILPRWACEITVRFTQPVLTANTVATLMAAAGMIIAIGDWRQEKGSGSYGRFALADESDADYADIMRTGGRAAQDAAMANPEPYDADTAELLDWWREESKRRGPGPVLAAAA